MSKTHFQYLKFYIAKNSIEKQRWNDVRIKPIVLELLKISALFELKENCGALIDSGFIARGSLKFLSEALDVQIKKVRPHLIPLTEARGMYDVQLPSSIGNYYGDIYETQFELAKNSYMNRWDKENGGVPPYWEHHLKPYLHEDYTKGSQEPKSPVE